MFDLLQKSTYSKIISLNRILERHFSYSYIFYFFFPELETDLQIYETTNNIIFAPIIEHVFDIDYANVSDEGDGYFNSKIEHIINDTLSFSFQKNLFIP